MYWRFTSILELADLPPIEQKRLWTEAGRDRSRPSDLLMLAFVLFMVGSVSALLLFLTMEWTGAWVRWPLWFMILVSTGKIVDTVIIHHYRRAVRRLRGG